MKYTFIFLLTLFTTFNLSAQDNDAATQLVQEGIKQLDDGHTDKAIAIFNHALETEKDNVYALCALAKAYQLKKDLKQSNFYAKSAINAHLDHEYTANAFSILALNYLEVQDTVNALKTYNQGLTNFPKDYELNFNLAVVLIQSKNSDYVEAERLLRLCVEEDPKEGNGLNALGRVNALQNRYIPSLMVLIRFIIVEPTTTRSASAYELIKLIISDGVNQNEEGKIVIESKVFDNDTLKLAQDQPDNFEHIKMLISIGFAIGIGAKEQKSEFEILETAVNNLLTGLSESKNKKVGYYWENYAPFFVALREKGLEEALLHILYLTQNDKENNKWIKKNKDKISDFYNWYYEYDWSKK